MTQRLVIRAISGPGKDLRGCSNRRYTVIELRRPLTKDADKMLAEAKEEIQEVFPLTATAMTVAAKRTHDEMRMLAAWRSHSRCPAKTVAWSTTPEANVIANLIFCIPA